MRRSCTSARSSCEATGNSYATISELCKLGRLDQALRILNSIPFSATLCSFFLQRCIDSKAEREGRSLYEHLIQNGFVSDLHLNTKLVVFYCRVGDVDSARRVFDEMPRRSLVSWTAMISGYTQNGYPRKALELFPSMHCSGFKANEFTYGSVLRACTGLGCGGSGELVHGCALKSGASSSLFVQSALVDMYAKCGRTQVARFIFDTMTVRDVVCWNVVIGGYAAQGLQHEAIGMFNDMLKNGMMPDHFTFSSILRACNGIGGLVSVAGIHGLVTKLGLVFHHAVSGSLITAYMKFRSLIIARRFYNSMPEMDLISGTALITGYAQSANQSGEALEIFAKLKHIGVRMDEIIICAMLNVCANLAFLSLGQQIHALVLKKQPKDDIAMGNALIDMYAKSGEVNDAFRAFDSMEKKNVISWTSLITGYGKHGYGEEAVAFFKKMVDNGLKPNGVTFLSLFFACSHAGLTSTGWEYFRSMVNEYKINPGAEHYSCMIDLLGRAGRLDEAYGLVQSMNLTPSASVWGAVLGACNAYSNKSLGEIAAKHLFDLEADNYANYIILSNIYASSGLWEEAFQVRNIMRTKGLKKEPGYSVALPAKHRMLLLPKAT